MIQLYELTDRGFASERADHRPASYLWRYLAARRASRDYPADALFSILEGRIPLTDVLEAKLRIECAPPPSRLHPVTAIDRQSPSTSVTCTYIPKVQHRSPGHLACKAPGSIPSALTLAALSDLVVPRAARPRRGEVKEDPARCR